MESVDGGGDLGSVDELAGDMVDLSVLGHFPPQSLHQTLLLQQLFQRLLPLLNHPHLITRLHQVSPHQSLPSLSQTLELVG